MGKAFAIAYIAAVGALLFGAAAIFRIRCEGFGCSGLGIAWFAWVALFLPSLGLGLILASLSSLGAPLARATRLALWLQGATGAVLFVLWAARNAH